MDRRKIIVVGAGASGMAAAFAAASCGASVTILEKKEQAGKKLSVTGNGHCNFTNARMEPSCYYSHDIDFVTNFLRKFDTKAAVDFFERLHLLCTDKNGYYYPNNMQASSVVSALTEQLKRLNVKIVTGCNVTDAVHSASGGFGIGTSEGKFTADRLILACGSEAGVKDRNRFTGYRMLEEFGHPVYPAGPALTGLFGMSGYEKLWAGVRVGASLGFGGRSESGELQLTNEGISGIPVFQLSHAAAESLEKHEKTVIQIDFLPLFSTDALLGKVKRLSSDSVSAGMSISELLQHWLPKKLSYVILKEASIAADTAAASIGEADLGHLIETVKCFRYNVTGVDSMINAQVARGGADLRYITENFESVRVKGLYVTGELLDTDGICGGYNLHFAFGSGLIAGESAALK